jgi:hypothetical protein
VPEAIAAVPALAAEAGAAISAVGATTVAGVSVSSLVSSLAIAAASYAINALFLAPSSHHQSGQQIVRQAMVARSRHYGRVKPESSIVFEIANNHSLFVVQQFGQGPIAAFETLYLGDQDVGPPGGTINDAPYAGHAASVISLGGPADTATGFIHSDPVAGSVWSSAHNLYGVAHLGLLFLDPGMADFHATFPNGVPEARALLRGAKVYDPRVAGQNSSDDPRNPATWAWSMNPALIVLDFLRNPDGYRMKPGPSVEDIALFHVQDFIDAANDCDAAVAVYGGGTEPRYQCAGSYHFDEDSLTVLRRLMAACDGEIFERADGTIGFRVGVARAPAVTITADHVRTLKLAEGAEGSFRFDRVKATYISPRNAWRTTETAPYQPPALVGSGREVTEALDLQCVNSNAQAQRLAKRYWYLTNAQWQGMITTDLFGLDLIGESLFTLDLSTTIGIAGTFRITSFRILDDGTGAEIGIVSWPTIADSWDVASEEAAPPPPSELPNASNTPPAPDWIDLKAIAPSGGGQAIVATWPAALPRSYRNNPSLAPAYAYSGDINGVALAITGLTGTQAEASPTATYTAEVQATSIGGIVGAFVAASIDPDPTTAAPSLPVNSFTVSAGLLPGSINFTFTAPGVATHFKTVIYAGTSNVFSSATIVGVAYPAALPLGSAVPAGSVTGSTGRLAGGLYYYFWAVAKATSDAAATEVMAGPIYIA